MTKKELLKALEIQKGVLKETQTHLDNIEQEIKKLDDNGFESTSKFWTPNEGEVFWIAGVELNPVVYNNVERFKSRNNRIFKYNRIFKTKEECQLYCDIQRAFRDASIDFDINKANYFLFYSYSSDAINYTCQNRTKRNNLYFDSEKTIKNLIDKFGEENIKKYYFGVY